MSSIGTIMRFLPMRSDKCSVASFAIPQYDIFRESNLYSVNQLMPSFCMMFNFSLYQNLILKVFLGIEKKLLAIWMNIFLHFWYIACSIIWESILSPLKNIRLSTFCKIQDGRRGHLVLVTWLNLTCKLCNMSFHRF